MNPESTRPAVDADLEQRSWRALAEVPDPEIPVLSLVDLGIIRYVRPCGAARAEIGVSPTYTGCPATEVICHAIRDRLRAAGIDATVKSVFSPAWSSDWLTESAREKLRAYGIAPPAHAVGSPKALLSVRGIQCPRCGSKQTRRVSEFASTPCKALHRCDACLEPFEYFKCI